MVAEGREFIFGRDIFDMFTLCVDEGWFATRSQVAGPRLKQTWT